MTARSMLFLQLKSPSLTSWSPTGFPVVGNVKWQHQRFQKEQACVYNTQKLCRTEMVPEEYKNKSKKITSWDVQGVPYTHAWCDIHTCFVKHKCTLIHSCVLWLHLSACLCWIDKHNPSVFACSIEKKGKAKPEGGWGVWEWERHTNAKKLERGRTLKCMGALASSDKAHNTPASNLIK